MDGDIGSMLQSVLSDPEQMAQIGRIAQNLMAPTADGPKEDGERRAALPGVAQGGDDRLLTALGKAFSGAAGRSRSMALLTAMRPYMRPEKQEKLDRAMKIAQMARVAGIVMGEYGGSYGI